VGKPGLRDVGVRAPLRREFAVTPALDDAATVDDADFVGLRARRQVVGDDDRPAAKSGSGELGRLRHDEAALTACEVERLTTRGMTQPYSD
jgi:hypothetical protein